MSTKPPSDSAFRICADSLRWRDSQRAYAALNGTVPEHVLIDLWAVADRFHETQMRQRIATAKQAAGILASYAGKDPSPLNARFRKAVIDYSRAECLDGAEHAVGITDKVIHHKACGIVGRAVRVDRGRMPDTTLLAIAHATRLAKLKEEVMSVLSEEASMTPSPRR